MNSMKVKEAQGILNPLTVPRLMTLKQASAFLGLTVWALRERVWAGQIPFLKFPEGRKIYIDRQDIEAFIKRNKTTENF
jgi:excisionase family DNA binding protein